MLQWFSIKKAIISTTKFKAQVLNFKAQQNLFVSNESSAYICNKIKISIICAY